jgi:hypothetical protein
VFLSVSSLTVPSSGNTQLYKRVAYRPVFLHVTVKSPHYIIFMWFIELHTENGTKSRYSITVEPRTQAGPITMSDNPEKRSSILAQIAVFSAQLDPLYKCYTFQKVVRFIFNVLKQTESCEYLGKDC